MLSGLVVYPPISIWMSFDRILDVPPVVIKPLFDS